MQTFSRVSIVFIIFASLGCQAALAELPDCKNIMVCEKSDDEGLHLLRITDYKGDVLKEYPRDNNSWYRIVYSPNKKAFFLDPGLKYAVLYVVNEAGKIIKADVPGWQHRPLDGTWVSNGILEIEMGFNPHAGISWQIDLSQGRVVSSQHCLEDVELAAKCESDE